MRGKVARALRKEVGFSPKAHREYVEHEVTAIKPIISFDFETKTTKLVERPVSAFITECTDGSRAFYQYLKKKWNNPNYEKELNQLPEVNELANMARNILRDQEVVDDVKSKNKHMKDLEDKLTEAEASKED